MVNFFKVFKFVTNEFNKKSCSTYEKLYHLRGENIFDTFSNVKLFNKLQRERKHAKELKIKQKKLPGNISKEERTSIKTKQKEANNKLQEPFFEAIKDAETMRGDKLNNRIRQINQSIFEKQLELKQSNGKNISCFDKIRLNNPGFRDIEKFTKSKMLSVGLLTLTNFNDIKDANNQLGSGAAFEEMAKTATMVFFGLSTLKYTNIQIKNAITALSLFCPAGRFINMLRTPLSILLTLTVKPIMDNLWKTEYEKLCI